MLIITYNNTNDILNINNEANQLENGRIRARQIRIDGQLKSRGDHVIANHVIGVDDDA